MGFLIGLLTVIMVLDCVVLVLLVLIQLPKKEAGMGLAFGGAATDALFGAGSGTALTKITKYAAGIFFVLAVVLSLLQRNYQGRSTRTFQQQLQQGGPVSSMPATRPQTPAVPGTAPSAPGAQSAALPGSNALTVLPPVEDTTAPVAIPPAPAPAAPPKK
jgi:preprotein translocase subunit SecG